MTARIDFFIAGAQKAGTTALDAYLRHHASIQMAKIKELHFFDDETIDWTTPDYGSLDDAFEQPSVAGKIRGEATPIYTYWPHALERVRRYNSEAKIIVGLRHPSFRAYSHWRMETNRGSESLSFDEAIGAIGRSRVASAENGVHRVFSYVERGFYAPQIHEAARHFPRERIFFYRVDELWNEPGGVLAMIQDFLRIERQFLGDRSYISPIVGEAPRSMTGSARETLDAVFAEDICQTAMLTGLNLDDWLDSGYLEPMQ